METKIIAFEGIDGSGKTLQEELLHKRLRECGYTVMRKSFPDYSGFFGLQIGALLAGDVLRADEIDSRSMCLWYALDRYASFKYYKDGESDFLLLNRYTVSNAVYQAIREIDLGMEDNWAWVKRLEHKELGLPEPDLYILLDVEPQKAQQNVDKKGERDYVSGRDVYESQKGLLERARERYLRIASRETNFEIIKCMADGTIMSPETISDAVWAAVEKRGLTL